MSRSVEHIVECHRLARSRRESGRPVWSETLDLSDVWYAPIPFIQRRDEIVRRIKRTKMYKRLHDDFTFTDIVDGLEQSEDANEFDQYWDEFYDVADIERLWIHR